ncbi:MAG: hypothetical protein AAFR37_06025 [Cyanobacteria bacterium J06628_3]
MTRRELQQSLKTFREQGLTTIKLTAKTLELQAEFDRVASCSISESTVTEVLETAETIHPEAVETNEPEKDTFIARFSEANDRAGVWGDGKTWRIIPKHKEFEPIKTLTQLKLHQIEPISNFPTRANCKYARINGHGTYLPPQAIEHQYSTNMDTQSLLELETIEQRLNDLIAEAPNIIFKGRLSTALLQISNTLDEAFKDA